MQTVEITGQEYTIEPCKALNAVAAIGILARHAGALSPLVDRIVEYAETAGDEVGENEQDEVGENEEYKMQAIKFLLELLGAASGLLENPHDVFRFMSLISGIDQGVLEQADLPDLWPVAEAIYSQNNLVEMYSLAREKVS